MRGLLPCFTTGMLDLADSFGNAPVHYAARPGGRGALQALLEAGAQAGLQNKYGQTPMHLARIHGVDKIAADLMGMTGAGTTEPKEDRYGHTAGDIEEAKTRPVVAPFSLFLFC